MLKTVSLNDIAATAPGFDDIVQTLRGRPECVWPARQADGNRLEPICTPVLDPRFTIDPAARIFTIGSCFARNVEVYLDRAGINVPTLSLTVPPEECPDGPSLLNKYTPLSVLHELRYALGSPHCTLEADDHFVEVEAGRFADLHLPAIVKAVPLTRARERRASVRALFAQAFESDIVIITLGLIEGWWDCRHATMINQTPIPVLRKHPERFRFIQLDHDTCRAAAFEIIELLRQHGCPKKILLTVSPVPLNRTLVPSDVIVSNTYSKSVLRSVAEEARRAYDTVDYIPTYEAVTHSDRRIAWEDDLVHVRGELVGSIIGSVLDAYMPDIQPQALDLTQAGKLLDTGQYDEAEKLLRQPQRDRLDHFQIQHDYGVAALMAGKRKLLPAAEAALKRAHQLKPDDVSALSYLARAYLKNDKKKRAFETAQQCIKLGTMANAAYGSWAYRVCAEVKMKEGELGAAADFFSQAHHNPEHLKRFSRLLDQYEQTGEALKIALMVVKMGTEKANFLIDADWLHYVAKLAAKLGRHDIAADAKAQADRLPTPKEGGCTAA